MTALIERFDVAFAGPNIGLLPKITAIDPVESAGSLLLLEPAHPTIQWAAGVPADAATVPNVFETQARALLGGATAAAVSPTITKGAGFDGVKGVMERSSKGGLHAYPSPTLADSTTSGRANLPDGLKQYILDNPTHDFYVGVWVRITKQATVVTGGRGTFVELGNQTSIATNYRSILASGNNSPNNGRSPSAPTGGGAAVGPAMINNHSTGWSGTASTTAATTVGRAMVFAAGSAFATSDALRRGRAGVLHYRTYIEDLTVSGRSYADVDAIDFAEYTRQVINPGGRYYGDTFTNPATLT